MLLKIFLIPGWDYNTSYVIILYSAQHLQGTYSNKKAKSFSKLHLHHVSRKSYVTPTMTCETSDGEKYSML